MVKRKYYKHFEDWAKNKKYKLDVTNRIAAAAKRIAARAVALTGTAAVMGGTSLFNRRKSIQNKGVYTKQLGGKRKFYKTKRIRNGYAPQKKTRFSRKVEKVLDSNKPVGHGVIKQYKQLRQATTDRYSYYDTFEDGLQMGAGTWLDINNWASIMYNAKTTSADYSVTTGNFDDDSKIHVIYYTIDFFIKSTSGHVVNIELYECTSKENQNESAQDANGDSLQDINSYLTDVIGTGSAATNGLQAYMQPELFNLWKVKKHTFKLQPGDHTSFKVTVCKNKTFNGSIMQDNGTPYVYPKGCKSFFFKVINDPTVSATNGTIHRWASSSIGGCAMECTKRIKLRCPDMAAESLHRNALYINNAVTTTTGATDQQVVYQNPLSTTTIG